MFCTRRRAVLLAGSVGVTLALTLAPAHGLSTSVPQQPTAQPSPAPTAQPSPAPTAQPSPAPTAQPSPAPTAQPSPAPTAQPSPAPTAQPSPAPAAPRPNRAVPAPARPTREALVADLRARMNAVRQGNACAPVRVDPRLEHAAQAHAEDMAGRDYFSHTAMDGRTFSERVRASGYPGRDLAENIASGFASAAQVLKAWMDAPSHRQNILDCNFTDIGVGFAPNGQYWVVNFGG